MKNRVIPIVKTCHYLRFCKRRKIAHSCNVKLYLLVEPLALLNHQVVYWEKKKRGRHLQQAQGTTVWSSAHRAKGSSAAIPSFGVRFYTWLSKPKSRSGSSFGLKQIHDVSAKEHTPVKRANPKLKVDVHFGWIFRDGDKLKMNWGIENWITIRLPRWCFRVLIPHACRLLDALLSQTMSAMKWGVLPVTDWNVGFRKTIFYFRLSKVPSLYTSSLHDR